MPPRIDGSAWGFAQVLRVVGAPRQRLQDPFAGLGASEPNGPAGARSPSQGQCGVPHALAIEPMKPLSAGLLHPNDFLALLAAFGFACSSATPPAFDGGSTEGGATDGPVCQFENPALGCRTSPQDCIPSSCACGEHGWACTADCGGGRFCGDAGADRASTPRERCEATGGAPQAATCCLATGDFPSGCSVGACSCAPGSSHMVLVCSCPSGGCFLPERGCVIPACTPGADQTCNDEPVISSLRGHCLSDLTCACLPGFTVNPATGRCR